MNRFIFISFSLIALIACQNTNKSNKVSDSAQSVVIIKPEKVTKSLKSTSENILNRIPKNSPEASVINFLKFYNFHLTGIADFRFVNEININDKNDFYKVNFNQTEKYLDLLYGSGFISKNYIKSQRQHFKNCNLKYQKTHQNDGPPEDLDYDLVMFANGDYEDELAQLDSVKVLKSEVNSNKANVVLLFIYNDRKSYDLTMDNKVWRIDKIENLNVK